MNKQSREELKRKIDAIRIPHDWWTESISQAIPVVLYRAGDNEWAALATQEIPKHITPEGCDKFTFGNEQRARIAEFAGSANPAAIQSLLAYVDLLEAQRDRLLNACKEGIEVVTEAVKIFGPCDHDVGICVCGENRVALDMAEAITESESQS